MEFQYDGPNALANMGVINKPIGTLEEIKKAGYNPAKTASCSPPGTPGVMPCPQWNNCPFDRASMGGFKGKGPKYVAYRLITDEGTGNENARTCYSFTAHMMARMVHGQKRRIDGKKGEFVRIIAQEGGTYNPRIAVKKDPLDKRPDAEWVNIAEEKPVPIHPRPGEIESDDYMAQLVKAEMEENTRERQLLDQAYQLPEMPDTFEEHLEKPKRGRPKGSKNKNQGEPDVGQTAHAEPE